MPGRSSRAGCRPKANGVIMGQRVRGLARVGLYVPGGTAAYPSSVLMNAIPAKIAGVKELVMVTPPGKDGKPNPDILAAALVAGVDRVFLVGGAQAVAALAFGTESIPKVDKIVGPGNIFVATAKRQLYGTVDIDMIAGPSRDFAFSQTIRQIRSFWQRISCPRRNTIRWPLRFCSPLRRALQRKPSPLFTARSKACPARTSSTNPWTILAQ